MRRRGRCEPTNQAEITVTTMAGHAQGRCIPTSFPTSPLIQGAIPALTLGSCTGIPTEAPKEVKYSPNPPPTLEIQARAGDNWVRGCPNNASSDPLKVGHQVDVFVCGKMLKATIASIRFGTHSEIGTVNMAMVPPNWYNSRYLERTRSPCSTQLSTATVPHTASALNSIWRASQS